MGVVTRPAGFFRGIACGGDFASPLVFCLICSVIAGLLLRGAAFLLALLFGIQGLPEAAIGLFLYPIIFGVVGTMGTLVWAVIAHLLIKAYVRPNAGFEATFRVAAYSSVTYVLGGWIPLVNLLVALYGFFLGVVGAREFTPRPPAASSAASRWS